jgi:hypothetical protein
LTAHAGLRTLDRNVAPGRVKARPADSNDENPPSDFSTAKDGRPNYSLYAPRRFSNWTSDGNKFHLAVPQRGGER